MTETATKINKSTPSSPQLPTRVMRKRKRVVYNLDELLKSDSESESDNQSSKRRSTGNKQPAPNTTAWIGASSVVHDNVTMAAYSVYYGYNDARNICETIYLRPDQTLECAYTTGIINAIGMCSENDCLLSIYTGLAKKKYGGKKPLNYITFRGSKVVPVNNPYKELCSVIQSNTLGRKGVTQIHFKNTSKLPKFGPLDIAHTMTTKKLEEHTISLNNRYREYHRGAYPFSNSYQSHCRSPHMIGTYERETMELGCNYYHETMYFGQEPFHSNELRGIRNNENQMKGITRTLSTSQSTTEYEDNYSEHRLSYPPIINDNNSLSSSISSYHFHQYDNSKFVAGQNNPLFNSESLEYLTPMNSMIYDADFTDKAVDKISRQNATTHLQTIFQLSEDTAAYTEHNYNQIILPAEVKVETVEDETPETAYQLAAVIREFEVGQVKEEVEDKSNGYIVSDIENETLIVTRRTDDTTINATTILSTITSTAMETNRFQIEDKNPYTTNASKEKSWSFSSVWNRIMHPFRRGNAN